ncbi:hypothetical protein NC653_006838 [Populus alba x Populus x berolinensis]|uniref:Transmembrane protein n=1 Tax=Populus alba x Populus x berolinensis TaxID=444605 RepID=A0AAD6WCN3_9ROSI|nr:hypothetical protein NC653_006838 [Populus alba x Populus x berolinensis]
MVFGLEAEEEGRRRRREEGNFEDGVMMWVPEWRGENAIQRPYHSSINSLGFRVFTLFLPQNWYWLMGTFKEAKHEANQEYYPEKIVKKCVICLLSILVCMAGGTLLLWWGCEYHPTNTQLWMVPLGLILLVTPVIAGVAAFVSETCNCKVEDDDSKTTNEIVV